MRRLSTVLFLGLWAILATAQTRRVSLLAVGDLNLGRHVGQVLLQDSLSYPFEFVQDVFHQYDIVFGNLESQISDQNGETQNPRDRFIFCAPPQAAQSLHAAGVTVVSTANNHAYDYKMKGLGETAGYLERAAVRFTGTSKDSVGDFPPVVADVGGVKVGFLAFTQFVNRKRGWAGHIALFDSARAKREIGRLRSSVDLVIVSFHGGTEYTDAPDPRTYGQMRSFIDAGADVVLGHHPHVPQGVKRYKGKWIFCSLGNFVFGQPQREWTQKSFAAAMTIEKVDVSTRVTNVTLVPLSSGFQPSFSVSEADRDAIGRRLQRLSNVTVVRKDSVFVVDDFSSKR